MAETFIDELESIVNEVSTWAAEQVDAIKSALAPDNRPFGMQKVDIEEQLTQYRQLRNSPELWVAWIQNKAGEIQNELTLQGVSIEAIGAIDPLKLAIEYALTFSSKMETELEKRMIK